MSSNVNTSPDGAHAVARLRVGLAEFGLRWMWTMYQELGPPRLLHRELPEKTRRFLDRMLKRLVGHLAKSGDFEEMTEAEMLENAVVLYDSGHLKLVKYKDGRLGWAMWKRGRYLPV